MPTYKLWCRLCWQEFDTPAQHDAASSIAGTRLNGHCPGDIHPSVETPKPDKSQHAPEPMLDLDAGQ